MDYHTQETGEGLRNGDSAVPKKSCCAEVKATYKLTNKPAKVTLPKLPGNTGNLIPRLYYTQFIKWYGVTRIPKNNHSDDQLATLEGFK